jgi:hypothetical protein
LFGFFRNFAYNPKPCRAKIKAINPLKTALLKKQHLAFHDNKDQKPNWVFYGKFVHRG